jgi:FkbM family methyltransferase
MNQSEHWVYTVREWSQEPLIQILNALPEVRVVFDIGANVGGWTHILLQRMPTAKVHCFEPMPNNFEALQINIPDAKHHQYGIYYGQTEAQMFGRGDGNVGAVFVEWIDSGEPRVAVGEKIPLRKLEGNRLPKPDLIKMDVEGAEVNIIPNSPIVKTCKWLIIEWHPEHIPVIPFFTEHLPNHDVVLRVGNQFLLCSH